MPSPVRGAGRPETGARGCAFFPQSPFPPWFPLLMLQARPRAFSSLRRHGAFPLRCFGGLAPTGVNRGLPGEASGGIH